jgi:hypothetical protein
MSNTQKALLNVASLVAFSGATLVPSTGHATIISGNSSAYGESVSLATSVAGIIGASITSPPTPDAFGTAPLPYTDTQTVASVLVGILAGDLSTGVLTATANSTVDGAGGAKTTAGTATVDNLATALLGLFGVDATVVQSTASVGGTFGALTSSGATTITGLTVNGASVNIGSTVDDVILNLPLLGVKITANEQIDGGNGTSSDSITVNALDISLTNSVFDLETLDGNIVIAQSFASETAQANPAPEPSGLMVLIGSIAGLFWVKRRNFNQPLRSA